MTKYYKFLTKDNTGEYSHFDYTLYLPHDGLPGEWLPEIIEPLMLCEIGYHACESKDLLSWINAQLFDVEFAGATLDGEDKTAGVSMRLVRKIETWNDRTARLFAVWCAREALKLVSHPDPRSVAACDVAERYANGQATIEKLTAARAAAWAAAESAAWAAAESAAWAAAESAAWAAAGTAARTAAWAAAGTAARTAAWAASWAAQAKKLIQMFGLED